MSAAQEKLIDGRMMTRETIVVQFAALVHKIARQYQNTGRGVGFDYEDLLSIGMEALLIAFKNYDPTLNVRFTTYAIPNIRGNILEQIGKQSRVHRFSRGLKQTAVKIYKDMNEHLSYEELAEKYNVSEREAKGALIFLHQGKSFVSIDDQVTRGNDGSGDTLTFIEMDIGQEDDNSTLVVDEFLSTLNDMQRKIVEMKHNQYTQQQIAKTFNVSQSKISREIKVIQGLHRKFFKRQA